MSIKMKYHEGKNFSLREVRLVPELRNLVSMCFLAGIRLNNIWRDYNEREEGKKSYILECHNLESLIVTKSESKIARLWHKILGHKGTNSLIKLRK